MKILTLDTATVSGWAAGEPGATPLWGSHSSRGRSTGEVLSRFRGWLAGMVNTHRPELIVFESPWIPRGGKRNPINPVTLRRLIALAGIVEEVAYLNGIEVREVAAYDIAKFFIGANRLPGRDAKKAATVARCRELGFAVDDDNEADALALWFMAEAHVAPEMAAQARGAGPLFTPPVRGPPEAHPEKKAPRLHKRDASRRRTNP